MSSPVLTNPAHRAAYLSVRLPATFAACQHVLRKLREAVPGFRPSSLLDLGAGPGTAAWAAADAFASLNRITLLERDPEMIALGRRLAQSSPWASLRDAEWRTTSLEFAQNIASYDLVIASYVFCELDARTADAGLASAWKTATQVLVIIDPGTPPSFSRLSRIRQWLIGAGAHFAAPCPHESECPLVAAGDWCHFSARLERSAEHRRLKGGSLGYEDEKFSYLCATRLPLEPREARIVRHPMKYAGHIKLELCTSGGIRRETVTRSQKEPYRRARKAEWGDRWPAE